MDTLSRFFIGLAKYILEQLSDINSFKTRSFAPKEFIRLAWILSIASVLLVVLVHVWPTSLFDLKIGEEVQEHHFVWLDELMQAVSWFGNGVNALGMVILVSTLFWISRRPQAALFMFATLLSAPIIYVLKVTIGRARPTTEFFRIIANESSASFPSGHVVFYVVFFGFLTFIIAQEPKVNTWVRRSIQINSLLLIALIPFSRIYLGAHWFTDVLGGYVFGSLLLLALYGAYVRRRAKA